MSGFSKTIIITIFLLTPLFASQFSPGDLNMSHAQLEGLGNCLKCHEVGKKLSQDKCLSCHVTLKKNIQNNKGLHSKPEYKDCLTCHKEHIGKNSQLVRWEGSKEHFPHDKTGYHLEGKHSQVSCEKCHTAKQIANKKTSYLGLSTDCLSCHKDQHQQKFSSKCLECHSMDSWKSIKNFNHSKTGFPLEGKHTQVACSKCHNSNQLSVKDITHKTVRDCLSCHKDQHQQQLSPKCTNCHGLNSWKPAINFDHDKTNYKLTGKHTKTQCIQCHKRINGQGSMQFKNILYATCNQCHEDKHKGRFGTSCEKCHTTDSWKNLTNSSAFNHDLTRYPLKGKHTAVKCLGCHKDGNYTTPLVYGKCTDCHKNYHKNYEDIKPCETCHTVNSFKPSDYTTTHHNTQTNFKLAGAHLAVSCKACHLRPGSTQWDFRLKETKCTDCHKSNHKGLFSLKNEWKNCEDCHNDKNWIATKFNHNSDSRYPLDGAHNKLSCKVCHQVQNSSGGKTSIYQPLPLTCKGCHDDK